MAVLVLRIDIPGADPATTPINEIAEPLRNMLNNHLRALDRAEQQVGLEILEGTWETE